MGLLIVTEVAVTAIDLAFAMLVLAVQVGSDVVERFWMLHVMVCLSPTTEEAVMSCALMEERALMMASRTLIDIMLLTSTLCCPREVLMKTVTAVPLARFTTAPVVTMESELLSFAVKAATMRFFIAVVTVVPAGKTTNKSPMTEIFRIESHREPTYSESQTQPQGGTLFVGTPELLQ